MQKPIYSADDEQLLMSQLWSPQIKDNPETFVLFAFPWGRRSRAGGTLSEYGDPSEAAVPPLFHAG